jgi:hypothetical protein
MTKEETKPISCSLMSGEVIIALPIDQALRAIVSLRSMEPMKDHASMIIRLVVGGIDLINAAGYGHRHPRIDSFRERGAQIVAGVG